jgi:hypothetical protein
MKLKTNNFFKTKWVALLATLVFFMFLTSYTKSKNKFQNDITRIKFISSLPFFKDNKEFIYFRDSIGILYFKNQVLYEFSDIYTSRNVDTVHNSSVIVKREIRHRYLLYAKKEFYGYYYDSLNVSIGKKVAVDSFLNKRAFGGYSIFNKLENHILLSSIINQDNCTLIEKYKCKEKKDYTYPDTTIIYYTNRMKEVEHTLSKELDENKKMKVKKIRALYNPQVVTGIKVPSCEIMFELKEDTITNLDKYKLFIEKHKK